MTTTEGASDDVAPGCAARLLHAKYRLLRPIGQGGMGVVWVAHNQVLDVPVAVKLPRQNDRPPPLGTAERVLSEARLAAQLDHPAICRVLDYGTTDEGEPFVVSELLHGQNLAEALSRKTRLSPIRAVQTILPIVDALGVAHARGVVHRDVKPPNIFLARGFGDRVQPKLLDFGIAQLSSRGSQPQLLASGTHCYMSPEQASGEPVDARSDLWSVCVTLYELVAGVVPFLGDDYDATLELVKHAEPLPLTQHAAGDVRLSRIVTRGLEKDPKARYQSAAELGRELAAWLVSHGEETDAAGQALEARLTDAGPPVQLLTPLFGRPALLSELSTPERIKAQATTQLRPRRPATPANAETIAVRRPMPMVGRGLLFGLALLSMLGCGAWLAAH